MDETYIISKMNEFMFRLNEKIGIWFNKILPKITRDWWNELVMNNLSDLQREQVIKNNIHEINGLDLTSRLRVFDRNWFVITSYYFVNNRERANIRKMQEVRNSWAHIVPNDITKTKVIADVETIIALMQTFDASMRETRDMEEFIFDVKEDYEIKKEEKKKPDVMAVAEDETTDTDIVAGSVVCLTSDESVIGAVIGISGGKYSVLINGAVQSFYREQIKLKVSEKKSRYVSLNRVKSALTAYQINNPGSSNLYSLNSARIDFVPYQFRPALKMIKSDSPRLLVADDVGVGKTIEAGLILKELEARSSINSVLVICPRPLVAERKWELEMKRFDENFTQLDGKSLIEAISETDRDGEWPDRYSKTIIPYSLFGEDTIMGTKASTGKRHKNLGLWELDPLPHFDLLIVDEAHNIRNANTWMYKGVELFCRNADAVVFLTATPLQNSNKDLYTLLNLLRPDVVIDKDTFDTMSEPNGYINNLLRIVRKQGDGWQEQGKAEITHILETSWGRNVIQHNPNFEKIYDFMNKKTVTRDEKIELLSMIEGLHSFNGIINRTRRKDIEDFCIRRTLTLKVPFNGVQKDLYDSLIEFESTALTQLHGSRSVRFMMCTIMRQAASCIYGLAPFMNDIVNKRLKQIQEDGEMYEYDVDLNNDESNSLFQLADEITSLSEKLPEADPKFEKMYKVICQKMKEDNNRIIIFSSFRHTLRYIKKKLKNKGIRVGQVDGSVHDEERFAMRQRFLLDGEDKNAIDVLLFSEVGCEGLDYQFCDTMINYDLPWNPMRIEQRIGRIDRRGQKSDTVKIYNMITEDTIDETIYDRCLSKIGVFEASIGDCSEILGDISEQISKIMLDSELTDEERQMKIEKMADNEIMKVHEMQKLEHDEKTLFGFDLSNYVINKDVQDAENSWISPESINDLVNMFMKDFLGEGEYIRGKSELKSLRLSSDKRQMLFDNLKNVQIVNNNNANKLWMAYLKSHKPILPITFDSVCAKDNRGAVFFTQMHPFVIQAAAYESSNFPCEIGLSISDENIHTGDYEFLIYAWKYVGLRPDIKLVAISDNEMVQKNVFTYMQYCTEFEFDSSVHTEKWDSMDKLHYDRWQQDKGIYAKTVEDECNYRIEQLSQSYNQRREIFKNMISNAEDEKIKRMRQSQLDKLFRDFNKQKNNMKDITARADIHTKLLVKGILHVI
ncbi:helicase-related protein [Clostridium kluyveri]|uniref:helicase-related protein n=1 Tax=Clostridium kluyveri TaxID=1534 RepID=UPI0022457719|nr:helicase-related protein [Clostridium kluyveri]UZQ51663.1 helicase-related protein [Clostridium kluyveri]